MDFADEAEHQRERPPSDHVVGLCRDPPGGTGRPEEQQPDARRLRTDLRQDTAGAFGRGSTRVDVRNATTLVRLHAGPRLRGRHRRDQRERLLTAVRATVPGCHPTYVSPGPTCRRPTSTDLQPREDETIGTAVNDTLTGHLTVAT